MTQIMDNNNNESNIFLHNMNKKFNMIDMVKPTDYNFKKVCDNIIQSKLGLSNIRYSSDIIHQLLFQLQTDELQEELTEILQLHLESITNQQKKKSLQLLKKGGDLPFDVVKTNIMKIIKSLQNIDHIFYLINSSYHNSTHTYPYGRSYVVNIGLNILVNNYISNVKIMNNILSSFILDDDKINEFKHFNSIIKNISCYNDSISNWYLMLILDIISKKVNLIENKHPVKIYNQIISFIHIIDFIKQIHDFLKKIDLNMDVFIRKKIMHDVAEQFINIINTADENNIVLNFIFTNKSYIKYIYNEINIFNKEDSTFNYLFLKIDTKLDLFFKNKLPLLFKHIDNYDYNKIDHSIQIYNKITELLIYLNFRKINTNLIVQFHKYINVKSDISLENLIKYINTAILLYTKDSSQKMNNIENIIKLLLTNSTKKFEEKFITYYKKNLIKRVTSEYINEEIEYYIIDYIKLLTNYNLTYTLKKIVENVVNSKGSITHYKNLEFVYDKSTLPLNFNRNNFNTITIAHNIWDCIHYKNNISDKTINELYAQNELYKPQLLSYLKSYQNFYNKLYKNNHKITKWYIMNGEIKLNYYHKNDVCELITLPIHTFILELFNDCDSIQKDLILNSIFWGNYNNKESIMNDLINSNILFYDEKNNTYNINTEWIAPYSPFNIINYSNTKQNQYNTTIKENIIDKKLVIETNILSIIKTEKGISSKKIYTKVRNKLKNKFSINKKLFDKIIDELFFKEYIIAKKSGIFYNTYTDTDFSDTDSEID